MTRLNNLELYHRGYSFASGLVFAHRQEAENILIARGHGLRFIPEVVEIFQDGGSSTGVMVKRFPGCSTRPADPVLESGCVSKAMIEDLRAGLAALLDRGLYPADALQ